MALFYHPAPWSSGRVHDGGAGGCPDTCLISCYILTIAMTIQPDRRVQWRRVVLDEGHVMGASCDSARAQVSF